MVEKTAQNPDPQESQQYRALREAGITHVVQKRCPGCERMAYADAERKTAQCVHCGAQVPMDGAEPAHAH